MGKLTMEESHSRYDPMRHWLAVSLLAPRGYEEGISNFLMEQGARGVEELEEDLKGKRLKVYFPQDGKEKKVLRALHRYLKSLRSIDSEISDTQIETTSILEQDWGENWKRFFKPLRVTSRFVVKPPWCPTHLRGGQMVIDIIPGMAFGTGTHATTKLSLRALEGSLKRRGLSVLDVGTGSGILSIAAAKLGAGEVLGVDIDGAAVENARENVEQNNVAKLVKIRKGRIGDIRKRFDVVVANIDLRSLRRMRSPLLRHLKSQGILILSGILKGERDRLRQHYLEAGYFQWVRVTQEEGWACLTLKKG
jgi:ribosomal protein L11 methyltransferase